MARFTSGNWMDISMQYAEFRSCTEFPEQSIGNLESLTDATLAVEASMPDFRRPILDLPREPQDALRFEEAGMAAKRRKKLKKIQFVPFCGSRFLYSICSLISKISAKPRSAGC